MYSTTVNSRLFSITIKLLFEICALPLHGRTQIAQLGKKGGVKFFKLWTSTTCRVQLAGCLRTQTRPAQLDRRMTLSSSVVDILACRLFVDVCGRPVNSSAITLNKRCVPRSASSVSIALASTFFGFSPHSALAVQVFVRVRAPANFASTDILLCRVRCHVVFVCLIFHLCSQASSATLVFLF